MNQTATVTNESEETKRLHAELAHMKSLHSQLVNRINAAVQFGEHMRKATAPGSQDQDFIDTILGYLRD